MKNKIYIILSLFLIVLSIYFVKCNGFQVYTLQSFKSELPHTLLLASTHGNEPAGYHALMRLIKEDPVINKGKLTIIPVTNTCGLTFCMRENPFGFYDINRHYPSQSFLNNHIKHYVDKADWIIDLHEGWGFHKLDHRSVGSGIYSNASEKAKQLTETLVQSINTTIVDTNKQFVTFDIPKVNGSLREYCSRIGKNYVLIETSGINNLQHIDIRIQQHLHIVKDIIQKLHN